MNVDQPVALALIAASLIWLAVCVVRKWRRVGAQLDAVIVDALDIDWEQHVAEAVALSRVEFLPADSPIYDRMVCERMERENGWAS